MSTALIRPLPETPAFRAPPHNVEAEQALLGAILVNNEAMDRVSSFLKPDHFYEAQHGRIYETAAKLIMSGKRATPITLKTFFRADETVGELAVPNIWVGWPPTPRPSSMPRTMAAPFTISPSAAS